ncbi:MAG: hypothetical protein KDK89_18215 [Alphaproteobacteria bacterium]|nr:hypothetical protein [Alphaproteobacteria bacterium]
MTVRRSSMDGICFAAEGMAGTAAATSLRRLQTLAEAAPAGRLFSAITTLTEMSAKATRALEEGQAALAAGDDHAATLKLARAIAGMGDLAVTATGHHAASEPPAYLRKTS